MYLLLPLLLHSGTLLLESGNFIITDEKSQSFQFPPLPHVFKVHKGADRSPECCASSNSAFMLIEGPVKARSTGSINLSPYHSECRWCLESRLTLKRSAISQANRDTWKPLPGQVCGVRFYGV